ncbi:MAG: hypothetical protein J6336_00510, partial [Kiritimatiellae bacterium]|nr:hypothetical protein [Kiritimatiellia bacterium]
MSIKTVQFLFGCLFLTTATLKAEEPFGVPPLLTTGDGKTVTTAEQWEQTRRPEILDLFQK